MEESQPDHDPSIQPFLLWKASPENQRKGYRGLESDLDTTYISNAALQEELTERKVEDILKALFHDWDKPIPDARSIRKHYLRPLAILLSMGFGRMIYYFAEQESLQDHCLPLLSEPAEFPKSTKTNLYEAFHKEQWQFCAVLLQNNMRLRLKDNSILPIFLEEQIGDGGSAFTYKIQVDKDYDKLLPLDDDDHADSSHQNTFVLKTYRTPEAESYFNNERAAFEKLRFGGLPPTNIIGYYGSFMKAGTFNIILEHADLGTLDDYMKHTDPPSSPRDIVTFWDSFFEVISGLAKIHGTPEATSDGPQILLGWHQDVNPSNVLVKSRAGTSKYDCDFKVADLGLSHFQKHMSLPTDATGEDKFGDNAYGEICRTPDTSLTAEDVSGAPETYRSGSLRQCHLQVRQSIDIWSMGCVLSEVAAWVTDGWKKVVEYRRRRKAEVIDKSGPDVETFHSGSKILDTVLQIHHHIIEVSRRCDLVTPHVIRELVAGMILIKSDSRGSAQFLYDGAKRIIAAARSEPGDSVTTGLALEWGHRVPESHGGVMKRKMPPNLPPSHRHNTSNDSYDSAGTSSTQVREQSGHPVSMTNTSSPQASPLDYSDRHGDPIHPNPRDLTETQYEEPESSTRRPNYALTYRHPTQSETRQQQEPYADIHENHGEPRSNNRFGIDSDCTGPTDIPRMSRTQRRNTRNIPIQGGYGVVDPERLVWQPETEQNCVVGESAFQGPPRIHQQRPDQHNTLPITSTEHSNGLKSHPHPEMSVDHGLRLKREEESGKVARFPPQEEIRSMNDTLKQRDHAFLIDNSASMEPHREQVRKVLELLSYLTKDFDPDGLDLYFTTDPEKLKPKNNAQMLKELDCRPAHGYPDMRERFAAITGEYQNRFGKRNKFSKIRHPNSTPWKGPRRLSLYVLTDGVWHNKCTLRTEVKTLVEYLIGHKLTNKQIGIQFIRFGNNQTGIDRLKVLDSGLKKAGEVKLDIVDTTSANGNVWKMLLGAVNDWFDDDDDDEDEST